MDDQTPPQNARAGLTVRARVIVYLVTMTAAALTAAGLTAYGIQRSHLDDTISDDLRVRTEDFLLFASGADPTTGKAFASADDLLREAVRRASLTRDEGVVAITGDSARYVPASDDRLMLENDPEFIAAAASASPGPVNVSAVTTSVTDYRYTAVPLVNPSGAIDGVYVTASDRGSLLGTLNATFRVYTLVAVGALGILALIAWISVGRLLRPLRLLERTARHISETDLSERIPIVGNDDLSRLTQTVNAMLDRLERAFSDQRQLLDDASHELRTPLTIVRNRLELLEPRDAEAVTYARDELLDEVGSMSRLVDDLVTLAKADRPEFVQPETVDLFELTQSAFTRAAAIDNHKWILEATASGDASLDAQRVTQAWLQLAANAVKFSPAGSKIAIGSSLEHGWVHMWVRDEGPGISASDLALIRERFYRVDPAAEGAGLGLTIVGAIAHAHGGMLEIASDVGVGSIFTISIPHSLAGDAA